MAPRCDTNVYRGAMEVFFSPDFVNISGIHNNHDTMYTRCPLKKTDHLIKISTFLLFSSRSCSKTSCNLMFYIVILAVIGI